MVAADEVKTLATVALLDVAAFAEYSTAEKVDDAAAAAAAALVVE